MSLPGHPRPSHEGDSRPTVARRTPVLGAVRGTTALPAGLPAGVRRPFLRCGLGFVLIVLSLIGGVTAAGRRPAEAWVTVQAAGSSGFTVDLTLPAPQWRSAGRRGAPCGVPHLAPVAGGPAPAPGATAYGWLVALPSQDGARVTVLDAPARTWRPPTPWCAADDSNGPVVGAELGALQVPTARAAAPADGSTPGALQPGAAIAELEPVGDLRGQDLARLVVRPLDRAPNGGLLLRARIRLRVDYSDPATVVGVPAVTDAFRDVRASFLNADFVPARQPHSGGSPDRRLAPHEGIWSAPDNPAALKLAVSRDGPTAVTGADLTAAGWRAGRCGPGGVGAEPGSGASGRGGDGPGGRSVGASEPHRLPR